MIVVARGEAKEGLDYIDKKFSESDQKSAARCDGVWRSLAKEFSALKSAQSCSQPPAVNKPLLCGLLEVDTKAASLGSSPVATGLVSAHSEGELSPQ